MKVKVIILCCILQSIVGVEISKDEFETRSISPRIAGGRDAAEGEVPYQCSMQQTPKLRHFCGCAILSAQYVITAAHCVRRRGPNDIEILVGTTKRQSGGKYYKVEEVIRHEKHDNPRRAHDVALIRLKTPIEFSDQVQPIKVSAKKVEQGENLLLSGFGSPKPGQPDAQNLQVLNVTSISNQRCQKYVRGLKVHDSFLCTMSPRGKGSCYGDSGGPLARDNELVGIASWVFPCALGKPDGFSRLSYLYDWIQAHLNSE